jgi:hypothetical protein
MISGNIVFIASVFYNLGGRIFEHLQEFAKIHLANIVIWQLAKIYGK